MREGLLVSPTQKLEHDRRAPNVENKLKTMVAKSIQKEFERDSSAPKPMQEPTQEERALHELAHLSKADWCESCAATRSREDNFETSKKQRDGSLDVKDALRIISVVMVDQESKFVHAIPIP